MDGTKSNGLPAKHGTNRPGPRVGNGWGFSLLLGVLLAFVYMSNTRTINSPDTLPTCLTVAALIGGDGIYLDRFAPSSRKESGALPYAYQRTRGHVVSRYPLATALLDLPIVLPCVWIAKRVRPDWVRNPPEYLVFIIAMCRWAAAGWAVAAAVVLHRLLRRLDLGTPQVAVPAVLASAVGSDMWVVSSQSPWQHGPAALMLTWTALLLLPEAPSRRRIFLAGVTASILVACRVTDVIFAAAVLGHVAWTMPRKLAWFLPAPLLIGAIVVGYNLWFFGALTGGQARLEELHLETHGVSGAWSGNMLEGFCGTLFSPNRGLLVFCPWVAVALAGAPMVARRVSPPPILIWLFAALVPFTLVLSKYAVWWGGHSFGPRYWTDVMPLLAVGLAYTLNQARQRQRPLAVVAAVAIVLAILIQAIGAFCYPSTWNASPANVDLHHERLWDWRDTELSRCLIETLRQ
ncbi:MAG: hypothetical protein NVSMB9_10260 [Isosphaeraceae bacterium]